MLRDARGRGHQPDQLVRKIHWLDGAQPQPLHLRFFQQTPDQVHQALASVQIATPAAQVDSAQHYFAILRGQRAHLFDNSIGRRTAAAPAHERDDTERAAVVAAILNLEVGTRAIAERVFHRSGKKFALLENVAYMDFAVKGDVVRDEFWNSRLVRVAHTPR